MSDHAHSAEEPEKDRTFTSVVVIGVALTLALGVWKDGQAAPDTSPNPKLMKERLGGVKVRFKGSEDEFTCVVLERGGTRHLLLPNGKEFVIPRGQEIEIVDEAQGSPAAKQEAKKAAAQAKKRPSAKRGQGLVINHEGESFLGMLSVTKDRVQVARGNGEKISIPMADVRWHKFGVNAPDKGYWNAFPNLPVKGFDSPGEGNELRNRAKIAFTNGDWPAASRAYMTLVISGETQEEANLRRAVYQWTGTGTVKGASRDREQALNALDVLFRPHRKAHSVLTRIQARALQDMAQDCLKVGMRKAAKGFAERLRGLGDDYAAAAQKILDQTH